MSSEPNEFKSERRSPICKGDVMIYEFIIDDSHVCLTQNLNYMREKYEKYTRNRSARILLHLFPLFFNTYILKTFNVTTFSSSKHRFIIFIISGNYTRNFKLSVFGDPLCNNCKEKKE